jgi:serine protease
MKKINFSIVCLLLLVFFSDFTNAHLQNVVNDAPYKPLSNGWPELKRGSNGLAMRFVIPKPKKISVDKNTNVAGLFIMKFTEGTHIRFKNAGLFFDEKNAVSNTEEVRRLARACLRADEVISQLRSVKKILGKARATYGFTIAPMFRTEKERYEKDGQFIEKAELEQRGREELADLDLYYVVYAKDFKDVDAQENLMNELSPFGIIEQVYPAVFSKGACTTNEVSTARTSIVPPTPDITWMQGYLDPAPRGLDARFAWTRDGGRGDNVKIIDVEYGWVLNHEDFPTRFVPSGYPPFSPYVRVGSEHGTAVLGILAAPDNGLGVTGFVPNVNYGLSTALHPGYVAGALIATFSGENWVGRCHNVAVAIAIADATAALAPGDVLLIEQHTPGPKTGVSGSGDWEYVPMEYYQECFDVIQRATAAGRIVVEAGGNGSQNLDGIVYGGRFNTSIRNSHAILVGASGMGDRVPASFSNTSVRMDVHAWGAGVVTLGYGDGTTDPFNLPDSSRFYTQTFAGTSSASPMVAGAIASIQGIRKRAGQIVLSPFDMRNLLVDTGTPQLSGGPIGPQPNLKSAIERSSGSSAFTGPGIYAIRSRSSGKMMDIDIRFFRGGYDGQNLIQFESHLGLNQQFRIENADPGFFRIIAMHSGKALDVWDDSRRDGGEIRQYTSYGARHQQFQIIPVGSFFKIVGRNSGRVLEVPGFSTENVQIKQYGENGGANQQWEFIRLR